MPTKSILQNTNLRRQIHSKDAYSILILSVLSLSSIFKFIDIIIGEKETIDEKRNEAKQEIDRLEVQVIYLLFII